MAKSKLTLNDIGIMELNKSRKRNILIKLTSKVPGNPLIATIPTEHKNIKTNNDFDMVFISKSIEPNFGCGSELFFCVRVSLPVYITIPVALVEAIIVLAQSVCSRDNPSFFTLASFEPICIMKTPLN